jgi:hypothetical protein
MRIHAIDSLINPALAEAIDSFEKEFSYPLGPTNHFRISHAQNHSGFFQSMGKSQSLIVERDGIVYGAIGAALRTIYTPHGSSIKAAYIGDFKVSEQARGSSAAYRLLKETQQWILSATNYGFCIVMNGTANSPLKYTGRLGITKFELLGEVSILRISIKHVMDNKSWLVNQCNDASLLYKNLIAGRWSILSGVATMRSALQPQWFVSHNNSACGLVEDTRKTKKLFTLSNEEILSAHLSSFAYLSPFSGAEIIQMAMKYASQFGYKSIFVAVSVNDAPIFHKILSSYEITEAQASIFGNLPGSIISTRQWVVNTAEI